MRGTAVVVRAGARARPRPTTSSSCPHSSEVAWGADSPLARLGFWRLVCDEAQLISSSASVAALAASSLFRRAAWLLSGTPVSRQLGEVQGLLDFLNAGSLAGAVRALGLAKVGERWRGEGGVGRCDRPPPDPASAPSLSSLEPLPAPWPPSFTPSPCTGPGKRPPWRCRRRRCPTSA